MNETSNGFNSQNQNFDIPNALRLVTIHIVLVTFETCVKAFWYYKNNSFEALRKFPNQTEKPRKIIVFWVLRGSVFPTWAALGGVQGVVLAILERLGGVLEPSWGICIKYMRCRLPLAGSNVDSGSPR